jgi:GDPmannose 4,6-dehydratase
MQWRMQQQECPEDYVIATGVQYSVREFVQHAAAELGITVRFEGSGMDEVGIVEKVEGHEIRLAPGDVIVRVDPRYFRPAEVETLLGDPSKAHAKLGWAPRTTFASLVKEMVRADYQIARRDALVTLAGFTAMEHHE